MELVNPPKDPGPVYAVLYCDSVSIHLLRKREGIAEARRSAVGPVVTEAGR
jgi:hypothetical protein